MASTCRHTETGSDRLGNFAKFSVPTMANGKVYLTTFAPVNASTPAFLRVRPQVT